MYLSKIASVSGTGRVFSSLMQSNQPVIYNWQRNMIVFDKTIHTGVKPFFWKGETAPKSLLSNQSKCLLTISIFYKDIELGKTKIKHL